MVHQCWLRLVPLLEDEALPGLAAFVVPMPWMPVLQPGEGTA